MSENTYAEGFRDGILEAATKLREAGNDHRKQGQASKKVLESQAHELAAALLISWANGFEIDAPKYLRELISFAAFEKGEG